MKLEKWALGAEILGGVAIVVTLIVLVIEVRGNTSAIQAQTINTQVANERERRGWLFLDEGGIAELVFRNRSGEPLSEFESWRLGRYYASLLEDFEWQFGEVQAGRLPERALPLRSWIAIWREGPFLPEVYYGAGQAYRDREFVEYWDEYVVNAAE
jgi:hypothetical protein